MWRERLSAVGVVVALVLLAVWVVRNTEWRDEQVPVPLKGEARAHPFYAAGKLVQALGGTAHTPQTLEALPPTQAVLVLTSQHWNLFSERQEALRRWVQAGGRLVVPDPLVDEGSALGAWLGVRAPFFETNEKDDEAQEDTPGKAEPKAEPKVGSCGSGCPWYEGRGAQADAASSSYRICGFYGWRRLERTDSSTPYPTQWTLQGHDQAVPNVIALRIAVEQGAVSVITQEGLFTQREVLDGDHARLLLDLMQFRQGDAVWFVFDEDADALPVLMWHTGAPVLVLLGLASVLIAWRSAQRFGPQMSEPPSARRSLAEQIRGTAEFLVRQQRTRVLWKAQGRALDEAAARVVRGWHALTEAQRQRHLARHCALDAAQLARARALSALAGAHEIAQAIAVLESARRRLLSHPTITKE